SGAARRRQTHPGSRGGGGGRRAAARSTTRPASPAASGGRASRAAASCRSVARRGSGAAARPVWSSPQRCGRGAVPGEILRQDGEAMVPGRDGTAVDAAVPGEAAVSPRRGGVDGTPPVDDEDCV